MLKKERYVVVTTDNSRRGVFGGILVSHERNPSGGDRVVLKEARMAVYWSQETRGVLGLASMGPQKGSRITPAIPQIELDGVTAVMDTTPEARKVWEAGPWD